MKELSDRDYEIEVPWLSIPNVIHGFENNRENTHSQINTAYKHKC